MKKPFKLLVLSLVGFIGACTGPTKPVNPNLIDEQYLDAMSPAFDGVKPDVDVADAIKARDNLLVVFAENSSDAATNKDFTDNWSDFMTCFNHIMDCITVYRTRYYYDGSQELRSKYMGYYDNYLDCLQYYAEILRGAYNASNYRNLIFGGMSDSEAVEIINSYSTPEEEKQYTLKLEDFENEAEELYNKSYRNDPEYEDKMFDLLKEYVTTAKEYAEYKKYTSYLDNLYSGEFNRCYTPADIVNFYNSVKNDLVPAIDNYQGKTVMEAELSEADAEYMQKFDKYNFKNKEVNVLDAIENYVHLMVGTSKAYDNLWSDKGYYCFSSSDSSLGTAYSTFIRTEGNPMLFFSKNYQSTFTFIHEFGHYTCAFSTSGQNFPMDISEIDSQGNEMLFASYLLDHEKEIPASSLGVQYIAEQKVLEQLSSVLNCTYVSEMEQLAYTYDLNDKEGFFAEMDKIAKSYGTKVNKKYWWAPALTSPGYYISYATSSLGALEFYFESRDDYDGTIDTFNKFIRKNANIQSIDAALSLGKLHFIYTSDSVKYIADFLNK